jgi:putative transposase
MVLYRRSRVPGGTYFFTVTLRDRHSTLLVDRVGELRQAFRSVLRDKPFRIDAVVVLPEHFHAVWTLPPDDCDYSGRMRLIKSRFSRSIARAGVALPCNAKGEYALWQRRFWEHTIRDEADLERHVAYIHFNPVKHGLVERVMDWPYSSFHQYVCRGMCAPDWAGRGIDGGAGDFGE